MSTLFGTDGIRGPVFKGLFTPQALTQLGLALGHGLRGQNHRALVGMDTRISGPLMKSALAAGLLSAGVDLVDVGVTSTPCVAFLSQHVDVDFCIMISASHNPYQDNGIKLFGPSGGKLGVSQETAIEELLGQNIDYCASDAIGKVLPGEHYVALYTQHLLDLYKNMNLTGITVALDAAHGSLWELAAPLFETLGARVIQMGHQPTGTNINAGVGATHPEALQAFMKNHPADIGFAFDGDGDRVMAFLADGTLLDGDQMLAILAQSWQAEGKLTPEAVVSTVMANHSLKTTLQRCGIALAQTDVGDKYVVEAMQSSGVLLGGESSGHMILRPLTNTGDGVLTALELLRIHTQIEPLALAFNSCPQILHNVRVQNKRLLAFPEWGSFYEEKIAPHADQVTCLIRASGTESLIRIMLQGEDFTLMEFLVAEFAAKIQELDHVSAH